MYDIWYSVHKQEEENKYILIAADFAIKGQKIQRLRLNMYSIVAYYIRDIGIYTSCPPIIYLCCI
jgi:hypothetical protein